MHALSLFARERLRALRRFEFHAVHGIEGFGAWLLLLAALQLLLYASLGEAKPLAQWKPLDIASEGSLLLLLALWLGVVRASRPAGPVSDAIALGLAGLLLGNGADLLDEFWRLPKTWMVSGLAESAMNLSGMLLLTRGLLGWREEQLLLKQQQSQRERLLRDHRQQDPLTTLADASYMAAQIRLERAAGRPGRLLMLGFDGFERLVREAGIAEADRLLAKVGQLLCLHLGGDELVCRYAGDRFVLLLPGADEGATGARAARLREALGSYQHLDAQGRTWPLAVVAADAALQGKEQSPESLMLQLAQALR